VGFVARPFGGILFGSIGDRFGRRTALVLAIFMMAIPTGCIGLLPTYVQIGIWAPALLTFIRILQGLSLGGVYSGSITFLVEHAPPRRRGFIGGFSVASLVFGFLFGSVVVALVKAPLTDAQYESWGWRIPFLLGVVIGFIGLYIREHCEESPVYEMAKQAGILSTSPVRDALKHELAHMVQVIGIYLTVTMPFYLVSAYFIAFTERTLGRSKEEALILTSANLLILLTTILFSAWLSDRIGRKKILQCGVLLFFCASMPLFTLMLRADLASIALAQGLFTVILGIYMGPTPAILVEIFPTRIRATGMALSYNVSAALFGGTAPMACQWLLDTTGNSYAIPGYVMVCAAVTSVAVFFYRDRRLEELR